MRLTEADVTRIASYLQLTEPEFIQGHTRLNLQRNGLALWDQSVPAAFWIREETVAQTPSSPAREKRLKNRS